MAFDSDIDVGNVRWKYVDDYVRRWIKSRGPTLRSPTTTVKMSMAETEKSMGVLYRNSARAKCFFYPDAVRMDAYDHAPCHRREITGEILAQRGTKIL